MDRQQKSERSIDAAGLFKRGLPCEPFPSPAPLCPSLTPAPNRPLSLVPSPARPLSRLSFLNEKREIAIISIARLLYPPPRQSQSFSSFEERGRGECESGQSLDRVPMPSPPLSAGCSLCHALISVNSRDTTDRPDLHRSVFCIILYPHLITHPHRPLPLPRINSGA